MFDALIDQVLQIGVVAIAAFAVWVWYGEWKAGKLEDEIRRLQRSLKWQDVPYPNVGEAEQKEMEESLKKSLEEKLKQQAEERKRCYKVGSFWNLVVRFVTCSPLTVFAVGLFVLLTGSVACEYFMATYGQGTKLHAPYMSATIIAGMFVWLFFLLRCVDFRYPPGIADSLFLGEDSFVKPFWLASSLCATVACICIFGLVCDFEMQFIKKDPSEFKWSFDMVTETLNTHYLKKWIAIVASAITALLSIGAVFEDNMRMRPFEENQ